MDININQLKSFIHYHKDVYDDFVTFQDFDKLFEFQDLLMVIEIFRIEFRKNGDITSTILLEGYIAEMKANAHKLWDIADNYFTNDLWYAFINDYCDNVLAL